MLILKLVQNIGRYTDSESGEGTRCMAIFSYSLKNWSTLPMLSHAFCYALALPPYVEVIERYGVVRHDSRPNISKFCIQFSSSYLVGDARAASNR